MMPLTPCIKCIFFSHAYKNVAYVIQIRERILANKVCSFRYRHNMACDTFFTEGARNSNRFKNYSRYFFL